MFKIIAFLSFVAMLLFVLAAMGAADIKSVVLNCTFAVIMMGNITSCAVQDNKQKGAE